MASAVVAAVALYRATVIVDGLGVPEGSVVTGELHGSWATAAVAAVVFVLAIAGAIVAVYRPTTARR